MKPSTADLAAVLQERGCYVFAFAGPQEVRELELGTDMASVNNLLGFLEKVGAHVQVLGALGPFKLTDTEAASLPKSYHLKSATGRKAACAVQVFNGGSDFNEPITRCLDRLHTAAWANSDILLVSDGELRQPGVAIMRKLAGTIAAPSMPGACSCILKGCGSVWVVRHGVWHVH